MTISQVESVERDLWPTLRRHTQAGMATGAVSVVAAGVVAVVGPVLDVMGFSLRRRSSPAG
ncbi:hypothetical protein [Streptomyces sp. Agncl-13]|uniref:hypothetical protein n=1 Tax=Streptomyces sp. Agncl-13 TaxID=3400628 RepID=UPI003A8618BD